MGGLWGGSPGGSSESLCFGVLLGGVFVCGGGPEGFGGGLWVLGWALGEPLGLGVPWGRWLDSGALRGSLGLRVLGGSPWDP